MGVAPPDFSEVIALSRELVKACEGRYDLFTLELVQAASSAVSEASRLAVRVTTNFNRGGERYLNETTRALLDNIAQSDSAFGDYVRDNPDLQLRQFTKVWSTDIAPASGPVPVHDHDLDLASDTKAFYQVTHRVIKIAEKIPNLKFSARGITDVRNNLIEHPENAGITFDTFGYSSDKGPVVKALRRDDQTGHIDNGFFPNANQFIANLRVALKRALAQLREEPLSS